MSVANKIQQFLLCFLFITVSQDTYAYFDPGTGSILIQVLVALIGGFILFFKDILHKAKSLPTVLSNLRLRERVKNHYTLAVFVGFYAAVFYNSNNIHEITTFVLILNIFLFIFFSLLLALSASVILHACGKLKDKEGILCGFLFLLFLYYMLIPAMEVMEVSYVDLLGRLPGVFIKGIFVGMLGVLFFVAGKKLSHSTNKVIVIFAIMSIIPLIKTTKALIAQADMQERNARQSTWEGEDIVFQRKPNVYFLLFDSYTNRDGLQSIGLSSSPEMKNNLVKKHFNVYEHFYTNMQPTRNAMVTYFAMDTTKGNLYLTFNKENVQKIIAGYSDVHGLFKKNGYSTKIIISDIVTLDLNKYLLGGYCFASLCLGNKDGKTFYSYFQAVDRVILHGIIRLIYTRKLYNTSPSIDILRKVANSKQRQFVYAHFEAPNHANISKVDTLGTCNEQAEIEKYASRINNAHSLIDQSIEIIAASDPNAMVIIASDHGGYILNRCALNAPLLTREEVAERQGAFLAIRWGNGYDGRYDNEIKSSANLFRYIFSYLAGHDKLLVNKPDDDAFYYSTVKKQIIKSIDDGVILPPPVDKRD